MNESPAGIKKESIFSWQATTTVISEDKVSSMKNSGKTTSEYFNSKTATNAESYYTKLNSEFSKLLDSPTETSEYEPNTNARLGFAYNLYSLMYVACSAHRFYNV